MGAPCLCGVGRAVAEGVAVASGVSVGLGVRVTSGSAVVVGDALGVGEVFLRFAFVSGVGLGVGVGEVFFRFGEAAGDGLGVGFLADRFRCFRAGVGVGVAVRNFLIFVPNDSSAARAPSTALNKIARIKSPRNIVWETTKLVGRFCETPSGPASDTDALQSARRFLILIG